MQDAQTAAAIANEVIDALGGTSAVAALCDVTTGAVSQWRTAGIPKQQWRYLSVAKRKVIQGRKWPGTFHQQAA